MEQPRPAVTSLHCPNPKCTHTFSAAEVARGGAVRCPKCNLEFRFKPPAPAPKGNYPTGSVPTRLDPPAKGAANPWTMPSLPPTAGGLPLGAAAPYGLPPGVPPNPAPGHPTAGHLAPGQPPGYAPPGRVVVGKPAQPKAVVKPEKIVHVRGLKGNRARNPVLKAVVVLLVLTIFVSGVLYVISKYAPSLNFTKPVEHQAGGSGLIYHVRNQRGTEEKAFTLNIDKDVWMSDKDLRNRLKCAAVFKRSDENADSWLGIAVQDYGFRQPREGELLNGAIDRLRILFGDSLQMNTKVAPAKIAGIDAGRCEFLGKLNIVWRGEVYLVAHHGLAYWIFLAAPTIEDVQQQFANLETLGTIAFTTDRRGWVEQPPQYDTYASRTQAFLVRTPEKVWRKNDPLTADENGEIYLSGIFQSLPGVQTSDPTLAKNATLLGVTLDRVTDLKQAYKAAVDYFETKKKEEAKDYKFAPWSETAPMTGELKDVGDVPGCVGEAKILRGSDTMRYVQFAVFNDGAKTYGLRFECAPENEPIWRREFADILKSIRLVEKQ